MYCNYSYYVKQEYQNWSDVMAVNIFNKQPPEAQSISNEIF